MMAAASRSRNVPRSPIASNSSPPRQASCGHPSTGRVVSTFLLLLLLLLLREDGILSLHRFRPLSIPSAPSLPSCCLQAPLRLANPTLAPRAVHSQGVDADVGFAADSNAWHLPPCSPWSGSSSIGPHRPPAGSQRSDDRGACPRSHSGVASPMCEQVQSIGIHRDALGHELNLPGDGPLEQAHLSLLPDLLGRGSLTRPAVQGRDLPARSEGKGKSAPPRFSNPAEKVSVPCRWL